MLYNNLSEQSLFGPRKVVLCGKVSEPLSDHVRHLVKDGKYKTLNDFVEEAIIEKVRQESEDGGVKFEP